MSIIIRRALAEDLAVVTDCVCQAFIGYILRIGKQPGPMLDDYEILIKQDFVHVAIDQSRVVGVLVLLETVEGFCIETVAVHPVAQGAGVGGQLLTYAESVAIQSGYNSIYLSTHRLMHESQSIYAHLGYVEFDRRIVNGYDRVFVRKTLS